MILMPKVYCNQCNSRLKIKIRPSTRTFLHGRDESIHVNLCKKCLEIAFNVIFEAGYEKAKHEIVSG